MKKSLSAAVILLLLAAAFAAGNKNSVQEARGEYFRLGTFVTVRVFGKDKAFLEEELEALDGEVKRLENLFSANIASSDVSRLNCASGEWVSITPETAELLRRSVDIAKRTRGSFDPAIGKISRLWGIGTNNARIPSDEEIKSVLVKDAWQSVEIKEEKGTYFARLRRGVALDLGAVAKGNVADLLSRKIAADAKNGEKITGALLDFGGNVYATGKSPKGGAWNIALQRPGRGRGEYFGVVASNDCSVVTSGPYERFFEEGGVRYHHIFDPRTGRPAASDFSSVSVIDKDSTAADALCTALFVMGREDCEKFLSENKNIAAVIMTANLDKVLITREAEKIFTLVDKSLATERIGGDEE